MIIESSTISLHQKPFKKYNLVKKSNDFYIKTLLKFFSLHSIIGVKTLNRNIKPNNILTQTPY